MIMVTTETLHQELLVDDNGNNGDVAPWSCLVDDNGNNGDSAPWSYLVNGNENNETLPHQFL
jgi:hypothetical protein